eukprot:jgi/Astpho2/1077/Aster-07458
MAVQGLEPAASPWGSIGRTLVLALTHMASLLVLTVFNRSLILNHKQFLECLRFRSPDEGLITVSNHCSTIDDPMVLSALTPLWYTLGEAWHLGSRWSLCDRRTCYFNEMLGCAVMLQRCPQAPSRSNKPCRMCRVKPVLTLAQAGTHACRQFFRSGKSLPVDRGAGVNQAVVRTAADRVLRGDWLHLFPEGKVNYTGQLFPLKWGIGKIICDVVRSGGSVPIVLPFYHSGIGAVLPNKHMLPGIGHTVTIQIGQPVDLSDIVPRCQKAASVTEQQQVRQFKMHEAQLLARLSTIPC